MGLVLINWVLIKHISLAVPVTVGTLDSIFSASVLYPPFDIVSLVEAALTICTSRV